MIVFIVLFIFYKLSNVEQIWTFFKTNLRYNLTVGFLKKIFYVCSLGCA